MYLKNAELRNIRCFEDTKISFDKAGGGNRKWTVLVGENGAGKTTLIKSIGLAMAGSDALSELIARPDDWIRQGHDEASISLEIETSSGKQRDLSLHFRRGESVSDFIDRSRSTLAPLNDALEHTTRNYPTFGYGWARGLVSANTPDNQATTLNHPRAMSLGSLFSRSPELVSVGRWAIELVGNGQDDEFEEIQTILTNFLPEITFSHVDSETEELVFKTEDGDVPLDLLSDGFQTIAAWVGDLLFQITSIFDDYRSPLDARGLLIIDHVDLQLHPKWQRRLLDFLEKQLPRMQLIVTTDSVVTAQQAPSGALHYCIRRDGASVVETFEQDPGKYLLHQLIATEAFGQMSDESLEVETLKTEYRDLHRKRGLTAGDRDRMDQIQSKLNERVADSRSAAVLTPEQSKLLDEFLQKNTGQGG